MTVATAIRSADQGQNYPEPAWQPSGALANGRTIPMRKFVAPPIRERERFTALAQLAEIL